MWTIAGVLIAVVVIVLIARAKDKAQWEEYKRLERENREGRVSVDTAYDDRDSPR